MGGLTSKQAFEEIFEKLQEKDIEAGNHEFWDELWKTKLSVNEIFEVASPAKIRAIIRSKPRN